VFAVAAVGATFAVAAPGAGAQSQCSHTDPACIGLGKLGERGSAECRRAGDAIPGGPVSDPSCQAPVGREVDRAKVAAHAGTWLHRALAFQYALGETLPFREAPWLGTHNSFNSTSEFPTASHTDSNQQLSLVDQLALDVRSLEVDVHWSPTPRAGADGLATEGRAPVVCHAEERQGVHAGCTTERLLGDVLAPVAEWLNRPENRRQVILLYLEDHLEGPAGHAAARSVLDATLKRPGQAAGSLVYRAGANDGDCRSLPLSLTRRAVLDAGAQVVIVGDCGDGWDGFVHQWGGSVRYEDRPTGYVAKGCGGVSRATYDSHLVRFYEDSTFLTPAAAQASGDSLASADEGIDPATAAAMVRCGVDLFGFDQLLPDDGRLESTVWSWAPGKPAAADGGCAFQGADARWATAPCAGARPAACRTAGGWTVTPGPVAWDAAAAACTDAGGSFGVPRTGYDNAQLRTAAGAAEPWLAEHPFTEAGGGGTGGGPAGGAAPGGPPGSGSPGGGASAGSGPGPSRTPSPRPVSHAAAASCRLLPGRRLARRTLVCAIRLAPGATGTATLTLTRGGRTYARAVRRLRSGGATVTVRSAPLPRGAYALTVALSGQTRARLQRRLSAG
jgi:hypothetical protein